MTQTKENLLVVDDDVALRNLLKRYLEREGYQVSGVADGTAMADYLAQKRVDLVILDSTLPGEDGLALARRFRTEHEELPIVMLSARADDVDRIVGLEVGADDYLSKPFNPRELLARIRAVLRRGKCQPETELGLKQSGFFSFGHFRLDTNSRRLTHDGKEIELTAGDFVLLRIFVEHPNRVLSRDTLVDLIKGYERTPFDRSIDVRVARLRAKIEDDSKAPRYIRTIWGEGYLFAPNGDAS